LNASGFILAGGRGTRMGRDKALLPYNGGTLIEHALATMRKIAEPVSIVGKRTDLVRLAPVIEDRYGGLGPLGGIEAALSASRSELNIFLPVDTPFVPAGFLCWMLRRAINSGAVATIPVVMGVAEPLIAVYSGRLLSGIRHEIEAGKLKTIDAIIEASLRQGGADVFRIEIVAPLFSAKVFSDADDKLTEGDVHRWFANLNRPADLAFEDFDSSAFIA
jgi:molybdopterin-guanine dinucleotide biosynthesis protein A